MFFKKSIFISLIGLVFSLLTLTGCSKSPLVQFMDKNGYSIYKLPRSDRGPGSVYRIVDRKNIVEVCEQLLVEIPIKIADLDAIQNDSMYKIDSKHNAELLSHFFKDGSINSSHNYSKNIEMKLGNLKEKKILEEDFFTEIGVERKVVTKCRKVLRALQEKKQLKNVFMVYSTLSTDDLKYNIQKLYKSDSSLTLPGIKKILGLSSELNISIENNQTLIIHQPRNIGFKAQKITKFSPLPPKYSTTTVTKQTGAWEPKPIVMEEMLKAKITGGKIENFDEFIRGIK